MWNLFKVACVVNIKLFFMDWLCFDYTNQVMQNVTQKLLKSSFAYKKPDTVWKFEYLTSSSYPTVQYFLLKFRTVSYLSISTKWYSGFFQLRSFAIVWNTHFIIFSFRSRDSFPEVIFWRQLAIISPDTIISRVRSVSTNTCNC